MFNVWAKGRIVRAAVVASAIAMMTSAASASIVSYSTTGDFNGGVAGSPVSLSFGSSSTLTFTGSSVNNATVGPNMLIGTFSIVSSATGGGDVVPAGTTFELVLNQTVPGPGGTNSFTNKITGTAHNGNSGDIDITWNTPSSFSIGSLTYTLASLTTSDISRDKPGKVYANVVDAGVGTTAVAVPVPASVYSGLSLLGLLGAVRLRRKFSAA